MAFNIKNVDPKKVWNIVLPVVAGAVAIINTVSDQKKEAEFESIKKAIDELQNK